MASAPTVPHCAAAPPAAASASPLPPEQTLDAPALRALQRRRLAALLEQVRASNPFYRRKFEGVAFDPLRDELARLPLTTRRELEQDQLDHPPYGTNLTFPLERYVRYHQTSGSTGQPLRWLDTAESWDFFRRGWAAIYGAAGAVPGDRVAFPFSFGPFIGFWGGFDGATAMGLMAIPMGGLSTSARLRMILDNRAAIVCCTPTYALRMVEVAAQERIDLRSSAVRALIVAGEPGGSVASVRQRIEEGWGARLFDHTGMTEIGPSGFECAEAPGGGVHLIESEFIAEVIDPGTLAASDEGAGELVITNLGRAGSPVIRYRTGDQVVLRRGRCACGRTWARLEGGILGRVDDMVTIRGNNVFPSAIEAVVRRFPEVAEFRVEAYDDGPLTQVRIEVEPDPAAVAAAVAARDGQGPGLAERVSHAVQDALCFRADVRAVAPGTLPRFEMKARRFSRRRSGA